MKIFIIKNEVVKSKSTLKINRRGAARRNTGQRQYGAVGDSKDFSQKITSLKIKNMAADLLKRNRTRMPPGHFIPFRREIR